MPTHSIFVPAALHRREWHCEKRLLAGLPRRHRRSGQRGGTRTAGLRVWACVLTPTRQKGYFLPVRPMPQSLRYHRSPQREAILEHVVARKSHLSAEEIYAALRPRHPRLSMGTVYRNLHILVTQGRLRALHFGSGQDLYDGRLDPHYHVLCRGCGELYDLDMPAVQGIDECARAFANDFSVESHTLVFHGLCRTCRIRPAGGTARVRS